MGQGARYFIIGLAMVAAAGWWFRDRLQAPVAALRATVAPAPAPPVQATPDVLYTWVDKDGVTHYEQRRAGKAERVVYDGGRLTPVAPVDPALAGRIREAAAPAEAAAATATPEAGTGPGASSGIGASAGAGVAAGAGADTGNSLHHLRQELQEGAQRMQATQAARHPDL